VARHAGVRAAPPPNGAAWRGGDTVRQTSVSVQQRVRTHTIDATPGPAASKPVYSSQTENANVRAAIMQIEPHPEAAQINSMLLRCYNQNERQK